MRYVRQNWGANSAARAGGLMLMAPPDEPERGLTGPPQELGLTRKQVQGTDGATVEMIGLTCKKPQ